MVLEREQIIAVFLVFSLVANIFQVCFALWLFKTRQIDAEGERATIRQLKRIKERLMKRIHEEKEQKMINKPVCCVITCGKDAEWEIRYGETTDDYTHACTEHVGEMLEPDKINTVYPAERDEQ
jgi:hypothetical protein